MQDLIRHWTHQLYEEFEGVCFQYQIHLDRPVIHISEAASLLGSWDPLLRKITISLDLIRTRDWHCVVEILKHEMAHQYVSEAWGIDEAHGPNFYMACRKLGVAGWAAQPQAEMPDKMRTWQETPESSDHRRLLDRARKLLALAESTNEHEAALAMQRARETLDAYHLDHLEANGDDDYVTSIIRHRKKRLEAFHSSICGILTSHFHVEAVFSREFDAADLQTYRTIELLGSRQSVELAEYVYWFLLRSLETLWLEHKQKAAIRGESTGIKARNSFHIGVARGFRAKLDMEKNPSSTDTNAPDTKSTSLMVLSSTLLDRYVNRIHPRLGRRSLGRRSMDRSSYSAGENAGRSLSLRHGVHQSDSSSTKFLPPS